MKTYRALVLGLLPLVSSSLLGCGEALEPGATVDSFRVLAERVDQPFARPGETVRLSSLSFDPQARKVTWAWASCLNPAASDLDGCLAKINESPDPTSAVFALGEGMDAPMLTIPANAISSLPEQTRGAAGVGVVSVACPGDLSIGAGPGGLPFSCKEFETSRELRLDEFIAGIKRIPVHETIRNQNPEIASITFDAEDWPADEIKDVGFCDQTDFVYSTCPDEQKHQLAAKLTPESFELGSDEQGRSFEEQVVIQYFATEGIFENEVKTGKEAKNGFVARKKASGQIIKLWFVARDDRGGVAWAERQVQIR